MNNLLPEFTSAGEYGWHIRLGRSPERSSSEAAQRQRRTTANRHASPSSSFSTSSYSSSKFSKQQRQRQQERRPGTAMQFFRPGSVLHDNVPKLSQRPRTSGTGTSTTTTTNNNHSRRRDESTLMYHDGGTDTVFLTRPPTSPEKITMISQHLAPTKQLLRLESERQPRVRPQSAMSLGQRFRAKQAKRLADFDKGGDLVENGTSGTRVTVASVQETPTELFLSAPSGKMDVLPLTKGYATTTTTRNLGRRTMKRTLKPGAQVGAMSIESSAAKDGSSDDDGFVFLLGAPCDLRPYVITSKEDEKSTTIKWSNCSICPVQVYWIDYNGRLCPRMRLEPGESYIEASWSTHPWFVQTVLTEAEKKRRADRRESDRGRGGGRGRSRGRKTATETATETETKMENSMKDIGKVSTTNNNNTNDQLDASMDIDEHTQGCLVVLSALDKESSSGGDCLNVVYNPPSFSRTIRPSKLSVSSAPKSTPQGTTQAERQALQADSHIITDPLADRTKRPPPGVRPSVVHPRGLGWGDRRAGRRPQSAKNSSREAVRILRDQKFRDRRVRHSARLVRMRQMEADNADCTITICPGIVPPEDGSSRRRSVALAEEETTRNDGGRRKTAAEMQRERRRRAGKGVQPSHRGISSSSSWK
jgi:hypothetical protein